MKCIECLEEKPIDEFYESGITRGIYTCKICLRARARHRERRLRRRSTYRITANARNNERRKYKSDPIGVTEDNVCLFIKLCRARGIVSDKQTLQLTRLDHEKTLCLQADEPEQMNGVLLPTLPCRRYRAGRLKLSEELEETFRTCLADLCAMQQKQ